MSNKQPIRFRKYIFHIIAVVLILGLFSLYRAQHSLYEKTKQINRDLVQQLKGLQEKNQQVSQAVQQITSRQDEQEFGQATFIDRKKYFRMNWKNYIHVSVNDYKTGFLGGIHGLKVTVTNDTEYDLDNVVVSLKYKRAKGEVFKTEQVAFDKIPAKKSAAVEAPDSRKGMSVDIALQRITSQEMNFCWSVDKKAAPGNNDPYQCVPSP